MVELLFASLAGPDLAILLALIVLAIVLWIPFIFLPGWAAGLVDLFIIILAAFAYYRYVNSK